MPGVLTKLKIREVSGVDNGAGLGVRVMLMKRDVTGDVHDTPFKDNDPDKEEVQDYFDMEGTGGQELIAALNDNKGDVKAAVKKVLDAENSLIDAYMKRDFSDEKRKELAASGKALPGGGYPIENEEDLHNAVRAFGRAKDKAKTKAHILARARSMGMMGAIPETWIAKSNFLARFLVKSGVIKAAGLDEAMIEMEVAKAVCSVQKSICSIVCDKGVTDKKKMFEETLKQFSDHVLGRVPESFEIAMAAAGLVSEGYVLTTGGDINKGDDDMNAEEMNKAIEAAVKKAVEPLQATIAKQQAELNFSKLTERQLEYVTKSAMTQEQKDAFAAKNGKDKDEECEKYFVKMAGDPVVVALNKRVEDVEKENKTLRESVAKAAEDTALAIIEKRVEAYGFGKAEAKVIHDLEKAGNKAGAEVIEKSLKAAAAALTTAGIFKEFGGKGSDGTSGAAQMEALVAEFQKADANLTRDQAIAKIAESRVAKHQEVWKAYKEESVSPGGRRQLS